MPITFKKNIVEKSISQDTLNKLIIKIKKDKETDYDETSTWRNKLKIFLKQTAGLIPAENKKRAWESSLSLPATRIQKEIINTRFFQALFETDQIVVFKPTGREDVELTAKKEDWFNWKLRNYTLDFEDVVDRAIDKASQHGFNIFFPYYLREIKPIIETKQFTLKEDSFADDLIFEYSCLELISQIFPNKIKTKDLGELKYEVTYKRQPDIGSTVKEVEDTATVNFIPNENTLEVDVEIETNKVEYDGAVLENLSIDDTWFPATVKSNEDMQRCNHVCRSFKCSYSDIARKVRDKIYDLLTEKDLEAFKKMSGKKSEDDEDKKIKKEIKSEIGLQDEQESDLSKDIEGYECYYFYDINDDGYDEHIVIKYFPAINKIASVRRLNKIFKHGKRPFPTAQFGLREDSIFAIGIPEMLHHLQSELDILHNQFINNGEFINTPWGLVKATSSFASKLDKNEIEVRPGYLYQTDDPSTDLNFPQFRQNPAWNLPDLGLLWDYIQKSVGTNEMMGGNQQYSRTPVGSTIKLLAEANIRIKQYLKRFNRGFKEALKQMYQLERDYGPEKQTFRIMGENGDFAFHEITREELKTLPDFELGTSLDNLNKVFMREAYLLLMQQTTNPLFIQMGIIQPHNIYNMIRKVYETYSIPDWQKLITQPPNNPLMDQKEENMHMMQGEPMEVNPLDDDEKHLRDIVEFQNSKYFGLLDPEHVDLISDHLRKHVEQLKKKKAEQQMAQLELIKQQQQGMKQNPEAGQGNMQPGEMQKPKVQPLMPYGGGGGMIGG